MSANNPPNPYFSNIDYNNAFFSAGVGNYLTLSYANSRYLFSTGTATSTATTTFFSGSVGIGTNASGINGDLIANTIEATTIQQGGIPLNTIISNNLSSYLNATQTSNQFLLLSGGTMTSSLTFTTTTGQNPIYIYSTIGGANNCIHFQNSSYNAYIGLGGTSLGGNYQNNLFFESTNNGIVFNTSNKTSPSTPSMIISPNGNVGINTTITSTKLNVYGVAYLTPSAGGGVPSGGAIGTDGLSIMIYGGVSSSQCMGFGYANSQLWYNVPTTNYHNFYVAGSSVFQINSSGSTITGTFITSGNVGINTSSTNSYNLYVNGNIGANNIYTGTSIITAGTFTVLGSDAGNWNITYGTSYNSVTYSLLFNHTGYASYYISGTNSTNSQITSDDRVKTDVVNITNSLDIINKLEPKNFNLLDDKDKVNLYGFIAQDVEQTLPQLVRTEANYIANIYSNANYDNDTKIITITKDISALLKPNDKIKIILDYNEDENDEIAISNDCKWYNRYKKRYITVKEIIDNNNFTIEEELNITTEQIFIYGVYADDFKTVDYNSIIGINTQAIKDLYAIIQSQQAQINQLLKK